jgi:hypothetical protein
MFLNDQLGDCTAAGAFHVAGMLSANAGTPIGFTDDQVQAFYRATTGYDPSDPSTDQGADEQTVLSYWQQHGLLADGSHRINGWAHINSANRQQAMTAVWLFENLYFGVELPDAWVNPMPSVPGFVWDVAGEPNPDNGHCFIATGYSDAGVRICTWGMTGLMTWAAVAKYASVAASGELYAVFGRDAISTATGRAPNGFDATQLSADLQAIGHSI